MQRTDLPAPLPGRHGPQQQHEIESERAVACIDPVEPRLYRNAAARIGILCLGRGRAALHQPFLMPVKQDCRQPGDPGARAQHTVVDVGVPGDDRRQWRARSDKAHVPGKDVPELRQFIQPVPSQPGTDRRDPSGFVPAGHARIPRVRCHRAEFHQWERSHRVGHPRRKIKNRPSLHRQQQQTDDDADRRHGTGKGKGQCDVETPLCRRDLAAEPQVTSQRARQSGQPKPGKGAIGGLKRRHHDRDGSDLALLMD